jgi:hypothetical protein
MAFRTLAPLLTLSLVALLGGCEIPGMEDTAKLAEAREAEGKAIGGACRHSGRALEDCYVMNPKAQKAAIYAGWRDMDAYMRDNKIGPVVPDLVDAPTGARNPGPAGQDVIGDKQAAETARRGG